MITIRPEKNEDLEAIQKVNTEAFGQKNEADLVEEVRKSNAFIPELSLVALLDGTVVGHILFSKIKIQTKDSEVPALCLAPMAVLSDYQNRGIGTDLVKQGLEECKRLGHKIVVVIGHPNYYPRFGFSSAGVKGLEVSFEVPDEAFMAIELDLGALNGVSGVVKFPKAFDDV
jgi:putative acetyltransferase